MNRISTVHDQPKKMKDDWKFGGLQRVAT